jgi:RNA polymerase-binding transcription factor
MMKNSEIQRFQRYLEIHREEARRSLNQLQDETRSMDSACPQDSADLCTTSLFKESLFQRSSERRYFLRLIEAALTRIEQGEYGVCAACGDEINPKRLEALPWTQLCLRCQAASEHGRGMDRESSVNHSPMTLRRAG